MQKIFEPGRNSHPSKNWSNLSWDSGPFSLKQFELLRPKSSLRLDALVFIVHSARTWSVVTCAGAAVHIKRTIGKYIDITCISDLLELRLQAILQKTRYRDPKLSTAKLRKITASACFRCKEWIQLQDKRSKCQQGIHFIEVSPVV